MSAAVPAAGRGPPGRDFEGLGELLDEVRERHVIGGRSRNDDIISSRLRARLRCQADCCLESPTDAVPLDRSAEPFGHGEPEPRPLERYRRRVRRADVCRVSPLRLQQKRWSLVSRAAAHTQKVVSLL
jgi:hypothetical protein